MRRFMLFRHEDIGNVSGTGWIAEGVEFMDGTCALRWLTDVASTAFYDSVHAIVYIHGHNGATTVEWLDRPMRAASGLRRLSVRG